MLIYFIVGLIGANFKVGNSEGSHLGRIRQGILAEMEGSVYGFPPCTNLLRSACFNTEKILIYLFKTSYRNKEVICTKPSSPVRFPWIRHYQKILDRS